MIKLENIGVSYGEKTVYENFYLDIEEGGITCVLGESGCGKTTLLNVIAGLVPHTGEVSELKCSYVFQKPRLVPNLTVKGNLSLVCKDENRINEMLACVNLADKAESFPAHLSGGEAQRVSICRAFLFGCDLLLMDEPFASLDLKLKISIMEQFKRLQSGRNKATLFVTHDVDEAVYLADRIIVISAGKTVWDVKNPEKKGYGEQTDLRPQLISKLLQ